MLGIRIAGDWVEGASGRGGFDGWAEGDWAEVSVLFDWETDWDSPDYDEDESGPKPPERSPQRWCNGAGVDVTDDEVRLWISTGDPRGAFQITARRMDDGTILLHLPTPGEGLIHEELVELYPGTLAIKRSMPAAA